MEDPAASHPQVVAIADWALAGDQLANGGLFAMVEQEKEHFLEQNLSAASSSQLGEMSPHPTQHSDAVDSITITSEWQQLQPRKPFNSCECLIETIVLCPIHANIPLFNRRAVLHTNAFRMSSIDRKPAGPEHRLHAAAFLKSHHKNSKRCRHCGPSCFCALTSKKELGSRAGHVKHMSAVQHAGWANRHLLHARASFEFVEAFGMPI